jgi:hypothetical protein
MLSLSRSFQKNEVVEVDCAMHKSLWFDICAGSGSVGEVCAKYGE